MYLILIAPLFWGVIVTAIIGLLIYVAQKYIDHWLELKNDKKGNYARTEISNFEKLIIQIVYSRRLNQIISEYKTKLRERLQSERRSNHYANLYVLPISIQSPKLLTSAAIPTLSVLEAIEQFALSGLVILGESGSGKSTSIKKIAEQYYLSRSLTPIIIELRNYQLVNSLELMMAQELGNKAYLLRGLKLKKFILFFDARNVVTCAGINADDFTFLNE